MGIPKARNLPDVASIGLGSGEVTPLDMADAYAPLSNGGYRVAPLAISKIVRPNGDVDNFAPERERALTDGEAYEVARILQNNIQGGTGVAANIGVPAGGKTGTTSDFVDAWFVGFTPKYSTAVWVGYPNSNGVKQYMTSIHGIAVAGGTFPAEIWHDFMSVVVGRDGGSPSFPLPSDPVSWSPFSSDFTKAAGEANSTSSAASTKSTKSTKSTTNTTPAQAPPPSTAQAPPPTPPPTTVAPPPTSTPAPTPPPPTPTAPATPPPAPPTTPTPPPPTTP
jgi:penicillin-binding protein 1A